MAKRVIDTYNGVIFSSSSENFSSKLQELKQNDVWKDIEIKEMELKEIINAPILAPIVARELGIDTNDADAIDGIMECQNTTLMVLAMEGRYLPIRWTANESLLDRARISGAIFEKLPVSEKVEILNKCYPYASNGVGKALIRDNMVSAVHSQNYVVLHSYDLYKAMDTYLEGAGISRNFINGLLAHNFCAWNVQVEDVLNDTQLQEMKSIFNASSVLTSVRVSTNDTATSAVTIMPIFTLDGQREMLFGKGISMYHKGEASVEAWKEKCLPQIFSIFVDGTAQLQKLATTTIENNIKGCLRGVAKKVSIPKKFYFKNIEPELDDFSGSITALDLFRLLWIYPESLKENSKEKLFAQEQIARASRFDWSDFDHPFDWE